MLKDFDAWNIKKKAVHTERSAPFYHEREIWWCVLGLNVGFEQDGTGQNYDRPVLIIKGFNTRVFFCAALTSKKKQNRYHHSIGVIDGREASVILSQVRLIDTRRLLRKVGTLNETIFEEVRGALKRTLFEI